MAKRTTHRGTGFTLVELLVVSMLMSGLTVVAAQSWRSLMMQMTDCSARGRAALELRLAVENLAQDLGATVGATPLGNDRVLLCLDGGATPNGQADWGGNPDTLIQYSLAGGRLLRLNQATGDALAVANDVIGFKVENVSPTVLRLVVQVRRAGLTRQATLLWSRP